jgi:hypothetical protein
VPAELATRCGIARRRLRDALPRHGR